MVNSKNHISKIDSLRGIAIMGVFLYHSQLILYTNCDLKVYGINHFLIVNGLNDIIINFSPVAFGWTGVQLFLIISGFLIHYGFLQKNTNLDVVSFFIRRFWRIYPPYLILLLFICFSKNNIGEYLNNKDGIENFVSHLMLIHNLRSKYFYHINPSFWSLALEVQLYLIYPLLLVVWRSIGINKIFYLTFLISLILLFVGMYFENRIDFFKSPTYDRSIFKYCFIWWSGALLSEKYYLNEKLFPQNSFIVFLTCFFLAQLSKAYLYTSYFTIYLITIAWLAFFEWFLYDTKISLNNKLVKILSVLGICSYSFYLIHFPYMYGLFDYFNFLGLSEKSVLVKIIPTFLVIFMISYSYYLFIEQTSIKFGKGFLDKIKRNLV